MTDNKSLRRNLINILTIFLLLIQFAMATDYVWPTNASHTLTTVFGDVRPRRYHAGLDIRTWGKNGYELYAIDNGYIERIRCGSKGYGKAIYIRLDDGNTAVYAHLEKFNHELDLIVEKLIQHYGKYTIDHSFSQDEFIVEKGEIIGYTGDTGSISGPHLHFEIRDKNERPINPLLTNFSVKDELYPIAEKLALIPLDINTLINGKSVPTIFPISKKSKHEYVIRDTISVVGKFGIAVNIFDQINDQPFHFGLYGIEMSIDGDFIYAIQYDDISFNDGPKVYTERDYHFIREDEGKFYRLFSSYNNETLSLIDDNSLQFNEFDGGYHEINILAWDFSNNAIEINATIFCEPLDSLYFETQFIQNQWVVTPHTENGYNLSFELGTKYFDTKYKDVSPISNASNQYILKNINEPFNVLTIIGTSYTGISTAPTFVPLHQNSVKKEVKGDIRIKHYEHGIVFEFIEDEFTGLEPYLILDTKYSHNKFSLQRHHQNYLVSTVFSPEELDGLNSISVVYFDDIKYEFTRNLSSHYFSALNSFEVNYTSPIVTVSGDINTFYNPTFVWIESTTAPSPNEGRLVTQPIFIGPDLIPYQNEIRIQFSLPDTKDKTPLGIYYYDTNKHKWYYMDTKHEGNMLSTTALSGEIFAVISENTSPTISQLIPNNGGTYSQKGFDEFSFIIDDTFSGIDGENDVEIILDGKPKIVRYNSYQKKVFSLFETPLSIGKHTFVINASDKVGNTKTKRGSFQVK